MADLILDTGVLVAAARGGQEIAGISPGDDLALPAVVVAEYLVGVALALSARRAVEQRAFLDHVLATVPVVDYDLRVARTHADLLAHVRRVGEPRGSHDLIIAATARATRRTVLTTDAKARFGDLPDVEERLVQPVRASSPARRAAPARAPAQDGP